MKNHFRFKSALGAAAFLFAVATSGTFYTSCTKSSSSTPKDTLPSATVAATLGNIVTGSGGGTATQAEASASMYQNMSWLCGTIIDTTMAGNTTSGGVTLNYSMTYADSAFCSGGTINKVDFYMKAFSDMTMSGTYYGAVSTMDMSLAGLDSASTSYTVNQSSTAIDTVTTSASGASSTYYFNISYSGSNIMISKSTAMITSGTASVSYSYKTSAGNTYNESATVKYIGNMQAVLTLANGYTSTLTW